MELMTEKKKGFKRTEVGLIPEDWKLEEIGDVAKLVGGFAFKSNTFKPVGKYQVVKMSNVYMNNLDLDRSQSYLDSIKSEQSEYLLKQGDIIISLTGTVGKEDYGFSYRLRDEINLLLNQRLAKISTKDQISSVYLDFQLKKREFLKQFYELGKGGTGNQTNVSIKNLASLKIPLPPTLSEQQAIATALSDLDELIRSLDGLIEKKEAIKKGTMQQLLSGKKRLPGFDGEWEVKKFTDVTDLITCGLAATPKYVDEGRGVPFLSSTNVKKGKVHWTNYKHISEEHHRKLYQNNPPKKGDILYSRVGTIGEAAVVETDKEFSIYVSLTLIKPKKDLLDNYFLKHLLNSTEYKQRAKDEVYLGGGVGNLNVGVVREYPIPVPSKKEQKAIAQILSDMDEELQVLRRKRKKMERVKEGMMQELLTGKTRLI